MNGDLQLDGLAFANTPSQNWVCLYGAKTPLYKMKFSDSNLLTLPVRNVWVQNKALLQLNFEREGILCQNDWCLKT